MGTIYKIIGGGQKVRRCTEAGQPVEFVKDDNSNWVEESKCHGQDHFASIMWAEDFETLQRWANEWAGKKVRLVEAEKIYDHE